MSLTNIGQKILNLSKQLYPTGRAWKLPVGSSLDAMHRALLISEEALYNSFTRLLKSILPDNSTFDMADADDWYRRLGMHTGPTTTLVDKKAAILRKLQFPGRNPAKQHWKTIQKELQKANFNVYIYENRFPNYPTGYITQTIQQFANLPDNQHGDHQHGDIQHGFEFYDFVVNHIDPALDATFDPGANLRSTFFIGGPTAGSYASIPASRKEEFRHLILHLKPVQTLAYLLINYI